MSMPVTGPAPRWWAGAVNTLGVVVAVGLAAGTIYGGFIQEGPVHLRVAGILGLAAIALLAWRYRHPMAVLATELVLAGAIDVLAGNSRLTATARFVVVISLYVVGTRSDALRGLVAAGCSWLVLGGTELFDHRGIGHLASDLVLIAAVTATFFYVRSYRELIESYRERAEQAEREQGWQTNRAVTAERVRIARELHDVVAHHVSLLVVQAGAVRETIPADHPTRPVLDSMIDGGRHAMTELRDMLDALRVDVLEVGQVAPEVGPRMPQPDVDQVPELVSGARAAGLDVGLEIDGQAECAPTHHLPGHLPDRPGVADQRGQARPGGRHPHPADLWCPRFRGGGDELSDGEWRSGTVGSGSGTPPAGRPRPDRNEGASGAVSRAPRDRAVLRRLAGPGAPARRC